MIAGGLGALGQRLAQRLTAAHDVLTLAPRAGVVAHGALWSCDVVSIPDAEVALAGAKTVVMLAQARRPPAKLTQADLADLNRLMADSIARAARRCGVERLVVFACGDDDVRPALLGLSGLPVSVLIGGGPDPVAHLAELVNAPPGTHLQSPPWTQSPEETPEKPPEPRLSVCSVQCYPRPPEWSARDLALAYFRWLPTAMSATRVVEQAGGSSFAIHAFGLKGLVLRFLPGRSEADSFVMDVADGALVRRVKGPARLEFRILLDGVTAMVSLQGFEPSLPLWVYRLTQAVMHEKVMQRFGQWLTSCPPKPS